MLEQWDADRLIAMRKIYTRTLTVNLSMGVSEDYSIESDDESEHFLLDVYRSRRNPKKARFQLRYRKDIVLARLCTSVHHTNPDGELLSYPHLHSYRESYGDKWASLVDIPENDPAGALKFFCHRINLPEPYTQGGLP